MVGFAVVSASAALLKIHQPFVHSMMPMTTKQNPQGTTIYIRPQLRRYVGGYLLVCMEKTRPSKFEVTITANIEK